MQSGITIAGGYHDGDALNQLKAPCSLYINNDDHSIYIADYGNLMQRMDKVMVSGNGKGNRLNQLNEPTDIIIAKNYDSFIIWNSGNRRVVR